MPRGKVLGIHKVLQRVERNLGPSPEGSPAGHPAWSQSPLQGEGSTLEGNQLCHRAVRSGKKRQPHESGAHILPTRLPRVPTQSSPPCTQGLLTYSRVTVGKPFLSTDRPHLGSCCGERCGWAGSTVTSQKHTGVWLGGWGGGILWSFMWSGEHWLRLPRHLWAREDSSAFSGKCPTTSLLSSSYKAPSQLKRLTTAAPPALTGTEEMAGAPREGTWASASGEASKTKRSAQSTAQMLCFCRQRVCLPAPPASTPYIPGTHHPATSGARPSTRAPGTPSARVRSLASSSFFRRLSPSPKDRTHCQDSVPMPLVSSKRTSQTAQGRALCTPLPRGCLSAGPLGGHSCRRGPPTARGEDRRSSETPQ